MSDNKKYREVEEGESGYDWFQYAKCKGMDQDVVEELFYPIGNADPYKAERRLFCSKCPVNIECLRWGNYASPDDGAFGGFSAKERRAQRRYGGKAVSPQQLMAE